MRTCMASLQRCLRHLKRVSCRCARDQLKGKPDVNVNWLGQKSCRMKVPRIFRISVPNFSNFRPEFCPEFCAEFSPNFSRSFRASFRGKRRPEKIHRKPPAFFNAKSPGKPEKKNHKSFLGGAGKVTIGARGV